MDRFQKLLQTRAQTLFGDPNIPLPPIVVYEKDFALNDEKACWRCISQYTSDGHPFQCSYEVLKVHPLKPIAVCSLDAWLNTFPPKKLVGFKNCDYIFTDARDEYAYKKVAFCDITCSDSKYVKPGGSVVYPEGKRAYMLKQMESVATWMLNDDVLYHSVATATHRQLVFGIRYTDKPVVSKTAMSLRSFTQTPSSSAKILTTTQFIGKVEFDVVEVTYPNPFVW